MFESEVTTGRVLVVDDDACIRNILGQLLQDAGYEVREAVHGADALDVLAHWRPDLILLDLMMPVLDGWAFRARQVGLDGLSRIPVIVLSAAHEVQRQAEVLGVAAVVGKPFDVDVLLDRVSTTLAS